MAKAAGAASGCAITTTATTGESSHASPLRSPSGGDSAADSSQTQLRHEAGRPGTRPVRPVTGGARGALATPTPRVRLQTGHAAKPFPCKSWRQSSPGGERMKMGGYQHRHFRLPSFQLAGRHVGRIVAYARRLRGQRQEAPLTLTPEWVGRPLPHATRAVAPGASPRP